MERIKDDFLNMLEAAVPLQGKEVLEVGCGDGSRSATIAMRCKGLIGIDPNPSLIYMAERRNLANASFVARSALQTQLQNASVDMVIFALSLHHIFPPSMPRAIREAVRVVKKEGHIVILEPTQKGPYFDAEIKFDAGDGDETTQKNTAARAVLEHPELERPAHAEFYDETGFRFESTQDFIAQMKPQKNLHHLESFLRQHNFCLTAVRHTQIFKPRI